MKILIMGLPGSGKTWLAQRLQNHMKCAWFNADEVRKMAHDWDFTIDGRLRQASRMKNLADFESKACGRIVICDFVCPTDEARLSFGADFTVWMNTIQSGRFEDTNKMFERPTKVDLHIEHFITEAEVSNVVNVIAGVHA
jgi:adenylylsulfate kinase